jgi:hypothetical protein
MKSMTEKTQYMPQEVVRTAKYKMGDIIGSLAGDEDLGIPVISRDDTRVVNAGNTAVVLELGNCGTEQNPFYVVGKIIAAKDEESQNYILWGPCIGKVKPRMVEETVRSLREIGVENVVDHREFETEVDSPRYYHLCPDLREGGRFEIHEIDPFIKLQTLGNREEARDNFAANYGIIRRMVNIREGDNITPARSRGSRYILESDTHASIDGSPSRSLRNLFLGRRDLETGLGEVFVADLDHLVIFDEKRLLELVKP